MHEQDLEPIFTSTYVSYARSQRSQSLQHKRKQHTQRVEEFFSHGYYSIPHSVVVKQIAGSSVSVFPPACEYNANDYSYLCCTATLKSTSRNFRLSSSENTVFKHLPDARKFERSLQHQFFTKQHNSMTFLAPIFTQLHAVPFVCQEFSMKHKLATWIL